MTELLSWISIQIIYLTSLGPGCENSLLGFTDLWLILAKYGMCAVEIRAIMKTQK